MSRRVNTYVMRTQGPTGGVGDFPVNWVIGGKRMQDPVTILMDGRWQVLPVYFHVTGKGEWVDYSELKWRRRCGSTPSTGARGSACPRTRGIESGGY